MLKTNAERSLAVFIDFENLALGFRDRHDRFDVRLVLKRLLEKGKVVTKKAYCDWSRFGSYTGALHEAAIELVEIPKRSQTGKNSADIRLCVDAMDLAYSKEHIDTFVIVSGDSDFSPLVSKLKELGKHVIGLGMADSTSNLLRDNCDEFIYYEDLTSSDSAVDALVSREIPEMQRKGFTLLLSALAALRRENKETLWSSMIKNTMKRIRPSFNETYHGYKSFSEMLEDAQRQGLLALETDKKSGTYVVVTFGSAVGRSSPEARPLDASDGPPLPKRRSRGRRGGRSRNRNGETPQPTESSDSQPKSGTDVGSTDRHDGKSDADGSLTFNSPNIKFLNQHNLLIGHQGRLDMCSPVQDSPAK
ncbi:hypothetical protein E3A20_27920, partial [Planctomyces bekefii]